MSEGATQGSEAIGLREWWAVLPRSRHSESFAAFDTRVDQVRRLRGSAAAKAARIARRRGYSLTGHRSFYVTGTQGPPVPGELERARAWGVLLGTWIHDQASEHSRG